nr:hypothetical protein [Tanacetum cinerariifolium]
KLALVKKRGGKTAISNSLVHSYRALSTLRCSDLRTAGAAVKPCQGDSSEFYLITAVHTKMYSELLLGKRSDIKFLIAQMISKSKIKILNHKHAEGTAKNSQENKALRLEVKTYAMTTP